MGRVLGDDGDGLTHHVLGPTTAYLLFYCAMSSQKLLEGKEEEEGEVKKRKIREQRFGSSRHSHFHLEATGARRPSRFSGLDITHPLADRTPSTYRGEEAHEAV